MTLAFKAFKLAPPHLVLFGAFAEEVARRAARGRVARRAVARGGRVAHLPGVCFEVGLIEALLPLLVALLLTLAVSVDAVVVGVGAPDDPDVGRTVRTLNSDGPRDFFYTRIAARSAGDSVPRGGDYY